MYICIVADLSCLRVWQWPLPGPCAALWWHHFAHGSAACTLLPPSEEWWWSVQAPLHQQLASGWLPWAWVELLALQIGSSALKWWSCYKLGMCKIMCKFCKEGIRQPVVHHDLAVVMGLTINGLFEQGNLCLIILVLLDHLVESLLHGTDGDWVLAYLLLVRGCRLLLLLAHGIQLLLYLAHILLLAVLGDQLLSQLTLHTIHGNFTMLFACT